MIDLACMSWVSPDSESGNCWFYDTNKMHFWFHLLPVIALAMAAAGYFVAWKNEKKNEQLEQYVEWSDVAITYGRWLKKKMALPVIGWYVWAGAVTQFKKVTDRPTYWWSASDGLMDRRRISGQCLSLIIDYWTSSRSLSFTYSDIRTCLKVVVFKRQFPHNKNCIPLFHCFQFLRTLSLILYSWLILFYIPLTTYYVHLVESLLCNLNIPWFIFLFDWTVDWFIDWSID